METEVKENSENVAPSNEQCAVKQAEDVLDNRPGEIVAASGQTQKKTETEDHKQVNTDEVGASDAGNSRQVRARKQVQRFSETLSKRYADEQTAKEKVIASQLARGSGTSLGDIPLIESSFRKCKPADLKTLHLACFMRVGSVADIRANLRKFNGFSFDRDSEEYKKREQILNK